jgi:hypothetical protein
MLTEYEVRRRMDLIRTSRAAPLRKARMLLKLGRSLNHQAQAISQAKAQTARSEDRKGMALLGRMASRAELLEDDVREAAIEILARDRLDLKPS